MTIPDLLALPDAELSRLVAEVVMGWHLNGTDWYDSKDLCQIIVAYWKPLRDYNYTHAVIERMREVWAAAEDGSDKWWAFSNKTGAWRVSVFDKNFEFTFALFAVEHLDFRRAVCVAAVYDRLQARAEGEEEKSD